MRHDPPALHEPAAADWLLSTVKRVRVHSTLNTAGLAVLGFLCLLDRLGYRVALASSLSLVSLVALVRLGRGPRRDT